ncbi:hypothetical protein ACJ73_03369 [Blastomyces percursus]|uniref:Uncharacterized protein n=1 Tax=Blastomyces percursus TaxID=1658174 RepID=A0A1J9Q9Y8_9EURO|nr:hypothetical protein ACJ73_03369 [Blastomyces percursus]
METRILSEILQKLSPSTVLDSEDLLQDFHQFFLRGAPEQCWKLVPTQYRLSNNANFSISQLSPTQAPSQDQLFRRLPSIRPTAQLSKEPLLHTPSSLISSNLSPQPYQQPTGIENQQYLTTYPTNSSHLTSSSNAYHQSTDRCQSPCPTSSSIPFNQGAGVNQNNTLGPPNPPASQSPPPFKKRRRNVEMDKQRTWLVTYQWLRLKMAFKDELLPTTSCEEILGPTEGLIDRTLPKGQRLYKFITKAAQNITKHVFAQRLSLIYSVHEIDKKFRTVNYACGTRLKTEAYKQVSKEWHCSLEGVKLWERRGKCYTKLMQEAGPAIIFELDKDVSGLLAAKIILQGLVAYGDYKYSSLRGAQSGLLSILRDYLSWGDDGTILPSNVPKDHISTNDPAHRMFVDHPGTSNRVESRRSTVDAAINATSSTSSISDLASARHIEPNQNEIVDPPVPTTVELPADQRRNLLEDTTQNAVDRSFPASLQLVTTTSTTETYMPYTDYWATQPDYIATSPAETYMPCTDYWVAQSSGLDTAQAVRMGVERTISLLCQLHVQPCSHLTI